MYKILPSQQGPVVLTDEDEVIFLFQYAHLMELYYEDNEILNKLKDFVAEKLKEYVEIEIKALKDGNTPGQGLLQNYINSIHNLKEFEYNALPQFKSQDGK
jgi:hypothetical protein